jgi:hypothetical protein
MIVMPHNKLLIIQLLIVSLLAYSSVRGTISLGSNLANTLVKVANSSIL